MGFVLTVLLLDVLLPLIRHLLFERHDLVLERLDLLKQARLVLLLQLGVLFHLDSDLSNLYLELFSGVLTRSEILLVLCHVLLQVVEHLQLLVESDQSVELVLELDLFLLESDLKFITAHLREHRLGVSLLLLLLGRLDLLLLSISSFSVRLICVDCVNGLSTRSLHTLGFRGDLPRDSFRRNDTCLLLEHLFRAS